MTGNRLWLAGLLVGLAACGVGCASIRRCLDSSAITVIVISSLLRCHVTSQKSVSGRHMLYGIYIDPFLRIDTGLLEPITQSSSLL